jgi:hypothetical protein
MMRGQTKLKPTHLLSEFGAVVTLIGVSLPVWGTTGTAVRLASKNVIKTFSMLCI